MLDLSPYKAKLEKTISSFNTQIEGVKDIFSKEKYLIDETNYKPSKKPQKDEISYKPAHKEEKQSNTTIEIQKIIIFASLIEILFIIPI